jgi:hypothetical protein
MSCTAAPLGEVMTPIRRGAGCEQAFGGQPCLELVERALQRADAGILEQLDQQLVVAARFVQAHTAEGLHQLALARREACQAIALAEHGAAHLRVAVLEGKIPVAGGRAGQVGDLPLHPQRTEARLEQPAHLAVEARDRIDRACRGRRYGRSETGKQGLGAEIGWTGLCGHECLGRR